MKTNAATKGSTRRGKKSGPAPTQGSWSFVKEGSLRLRVPTAKVVSAALPVFYNPAMTLNRDITILLLAALKRKGLRIADPLAGSGVRALRMLKELPSSVIKTIYANDANPLFPKTLAANAGLNKLSAAARKKIAVTTDDANSMLRSVGVDYVDIDPFGSPAPFMDAACARLSRGGILALTATDTAALAGTSPAACRRKYWSTPLRCPLKHEIGMRILARKAQLVAAQYEKALVPIYCHATEHYTRLYLLALKSKAAVEEVLSGHGYVAYDQKTGAFSVRGHNKPMTTTERVAGPLWTGALWDPELADTMLTLSRKPAFAGTITDDTKRLVALIAEESCIGAPFFEDVHDITSRLRQGPPGFESIMIALGRQGHAASRTHFLPSGIRTTAPLACVKNAIMSLSR